ncbi:MAG: hypothetical protein ACLSFC_15420 [Enterocloster bolteae]
MKGMKKCTSDIIISVVLLGFLLTLIMQMPEIPKDSRKYPWFFWASAISWLPFSLSVTCWLIKIQKLYRAS